ncbi:MULTISPECIES: SsgA family sporulation/cell division regulator [unclassified Streptomyces]|uniref:SsgA family sporulation/cell division regulator n=1 Tax=unclassified Streptomyces TaxID=2593676 RepID=UPI002E3823BD|nr:MULTISPECIES: SsgA family sporulation/cell division regulator [unclassified Streptomyces]WUC68161.1 SsgA family sporulation/cell division regulator [Streptomyces sp. NBC_00539]
MTFLIHARVATAGGAPLLVQLSYTASDPVAVRAVILHAGEPLACWYFERQMLADGLHRPVGEGAVRFRPVSSGPKRDLRIELRGADRAGQDRAVLLANADGVAAFLNRTYAAVPADSESAHLDDQLDALLSR